MKKRRWSKEEKLAILKKVSSAANKEVALREAGVFPSTYYSWKKKYNVDGESGLSDERGRKVSTERIAELEDKVSLLKELLANKEIEIALQDELLKKKYPRVKRKP